MTPRGKIYRKEYAAELLSIAKGDLESAKSLVGASGRDENVVALGQVVIRWAQSSLKLK